MVTTCIVTAKKSTRKFSVALYATQPAWISGFHNGLQESSRIYRIITNWLRTDENTSRNAYKTPVLKAPEYEQGGYSYQTHVFRSGKEQAHDTRKSECKTMRWLTTVPYEATAKLLRHDFNSFCGQCHTARVLAHTAISVC